MSNDSRFVVLMGGANTRLYHLSIDAQLQTHLNNTNHPELDMTSDLGMGSTTVPTLCGKSISDAIVAFVEVRNKPLTYVCKTCRSKYERQVKS